MYEHLSPEVRGALDLPRNERIAYCQNDRWVGYTRAEAILSQFHDLIIHPKVIRMPNLLLVGRSDNGKSSIIRRFVQAHPIVFSNEDKVVPSVLWIAMPATPTEGSFWSALLDRMGICHRTRDHVDKKRHQAEQIMQHLNVRLLIIDEFNHLGNAGKDAPRILAAIKNMSTAMNLSIIASGTQAAINALNSDPQLKSRFDPIALDRWKLDVEYLRFLKSYEALIPLAEPSNLSGRELAGIIYSMGGDTIGGTVKVLKKASVHAIRTGKERIDAKVLSSLPHVKADQWNEIAGRA